MPLTSFTIDGVEVNPKVEGFEIRETHGGVSTLTCQIESVGSPVLQFGIHEDVNVEEGGIKVFAGTVSQTRVNGDGGPNLYSAGGAPQITWTITAEDHNRLAERVYVTETVIAGTTLTAFLAVLVPYLPGVTLHGSQATGPNLPAMRFDRQRASDVLKALSDATGYTWRIDYDKQLRMWQAGDLLAPFDIDEFDDPVKWTGDVEVERMFGDNYANRVIVISDPIQEVGHIETFVGDGVNATVTLAYTLTGQYGYVTYDGNYETLRIPTDPDPASWTYDPANNTLTRSAGPLGNGLILSITFDGTFQATATAEDAAAIAAFGVFEHIERVSNITTAAAAQVIADAILAERLNAGENVVGYETRWTAPTLRAGQQQTISATARSVSGAHLITDLRVRAETPVTAVYAASGLGLIRNVTAKQNQLLGGKWQYTYRDWLGGGAAAGSATTVVGSGSVPQVGPGGPDTAVQFNKAGVFGGDDAFIYLHAQNSVVCGGGGSSITATNYESCQVFGYDTHIEDP